MEIADAAVTAAASASRAFICRQLLCVAIYERTP
jgi:hypothetical protein